MLQNYIKIALRNLVRNKTYSIMNVLGLTVGITGSVLLYLYINNELRYDAFHEKSDRIYRIVEIAKNGDQEARYFGNTAPILGTTLKESFPEIEAVVRLFKPGGHLDMKWKGKRVHERSWFLADTNFFKVFDFEFIDGNEETALSQPNSAVISKRKAIQYFGDENPIGKVLPFVQLRGGGVTITGMIENIPENSHLQFDILLSRQLSGIDMSEYLTRWEESGAFTYVLIDRSTHMPSFKSKLKSYASKQQTVNENAKDFYLQPIRDIYFESDKIEYGIEAARGNKSYIYIFSAIGIFLLVIAGINYTNLATALSIQRGKEIGIRKVAGAEKRQLMTQFLSESITIAFFACIFSYLLIELLLPYFNDLTGKQFVINLDSIGSTALVVLAIGLLLGLASGSYPALYLAWIQPISALKTGGGVKGGHVALRKGLVVVQFCLSIVLIICTLAAWKQINYIRAIDLGFDREQVVVVDINTGEVRSGFQAMKQEFEKIPGVQVAAVSSKIPGFRTENIVQLFAYPQQRMPNDSIAVNFMSFDEDMLRTYDISLKAGRNFTGNKVSDSLTILINQQAANTFGWEDPVGQLVQLAGVGEPMRVVGVVEDFNFQSLHQKVGPLIISYWANPVQRIDYFSIKIAGTDILGTIDNIKKVHQQFDPVTAMEYHFLDQQIDKIYETDVRAAGLFALGGGVAIFIACLGLFGLTLFSTERRVKEIGIRKVMGASISDIIQMLAVDFIKQVALAFLIAIPLGWMIVDNWLQNFAYRTPLDIGVFAIAGLGAILISILTVSWKAINAAVANPVKSLRSD